MSLLKELRRRNVFRVGIAYGVAAWLLIQIADTVFPRIGLPESAVTLVIAMLAIGFVPALIFAWAFELTPEGVKREKDVERDDSIMAQTGRKLDRAIIAGLVLVIVVMAVERVWFAGQETTATKPGAGEPGAPLVDLAKTIAVLPFADLSQAQDQAWFSLGLAEEILNALARAPDLLVASRTSSFAYRDGTVPIAQIAAELGVAHVLEGSVRRAGKRIRVTAQLIRAADGFHVWSENYDRNEDDVIALQEELAISIARALKTTMDPTALAEMLQAGTRSVEAYEHYLTGLGLSARAWDEPGWESYLLGYEEFENAREIDPGFSSAHHRAALFWYDQISISRRPSGLVSVPPSEKMNAFRERIGQAIETSGNPVDRMKFEALLARLGTRFRDSIALSLNVLAERPFDFENVELLLESAQDANDQDAQSKAFEHAYELWQKGPDWLRAAISGAWRLTFSGGETGIDNADWIHRAAMQSGKPSPAYQAHRALLWLGETERAAELLPLLAGETGSSRALIDARQACAEGRRSDAELILAKLPADWKPERRASTAWHLHQLLGQPDLAVAALRPFESVDSPLTVAAYLGYPDFDPASFPVVLATVQREGIRRPPPVKITFACPEENVIGRQSVAVLPFENISGDDANLPFTVGIHDDLLTQVSKIASLKTISRTSVLQYRGTEKTIPEIARELGVASVLEGGVQRVGDNVRINVQLIDAATDEHIWAETYDRELSAANIFAIQSEIATAIATTLEAALTDADKRRLASTPTRNLDALDAYFLGKQLADIRAEVNIRQSIAYFDLAIELDPEFALAHAGRAYAWLLMPEYDADLDRDLARANARAAADRALALDPDLPEGLTVSAWTELTQNYDWAAAEALLNRAVRIHPGNLDALHWLSHVLSWQGRQDEALEVAHRAVEFDPFSPLMLMNLSYIQMDARRYDESIRTRDRTLQVKSDMHEQMRNIWLTFLRAGRYADAADALLLWAEGTGRDVQAARELGQLLAHRGTGGATVELPAATLETLELGTENLAQVYAAAGDAENTLRQLEIALGERAGSRSVLSMKINPLYDFIRADPRFQEMLREVNLAP
jgi:TolB-like protein